MSKGGHYSVRVVDKGLDPLIKTLRAIGHGGSYVKVGVVGEKAEGIHQGDEAQGITMATLAAVHEFGTDSIPARSWIRSTFNEKRVEYIETLRKLLKGVYEQKTTVEKTLKIMGLKMVSDQKSKIRSGLTPPLSERTMKIRAEKAAWNKGGKSAKDGFKPLIDTGQLINSITFKVVLQTFGAAQPRAPQKVEDILG